MTTKRNGLQSRLARLLLGLLLALGTPMAGAEVLYVHTDHLGTPRLMSNEQGITVWRNLPTTEPFGNSPVEEDPDGDSVTTTLNSRFPGQYFDRETNLNYNYFRDCYDPLTGRYCQPDPLGLRGGDPSLYLYAKNNPLSFTDPRGESAAAVVVGGGVLIVGGAIYMSGPTGKKAIKSIAQKIQELCTPTPKDPCDERQEEEEEACGKYLGHWSYGGCMERARIRGDLCRRGIPDQPPQWSDADVNGWAPPSVPRGKR